MKCIKCVQRPVLRQTGWGKDHPELACPVCKALYYRTKDDLFVTERPFQWPTGKKPGNYKYI
jgi:hypothetical protein